VGADGEPGTGSRPDIAAGWDRLADAYQRDVGWPEDELTWGFRCPSEQHLGLVGDVVPDAATVVVGCGGGQDLVALAALAPRSLTGVDPSEVQLRHARERLASAGIDASLQLGAAERLLGLDDGCADVVVSVQALNYVEDLTSAVAELHRILRPGGVLAFSVLHPADLSTRDEPPYAWHTSWFEVARDWVWDGLAASAVPLRSWFRSPSDWFTALTDGGFVVERLLEPEPVDDRRWIERGWLDEHSYAKLDLVPGTILVRARRPVDAEAGSPTGGVGP
jgi:SAM-dependent methyltransferase